MVGKSTGGLEGSLDLTGGEQALSERDADIVHQIAQEGLTGFSFDGLRRLTGAHPETLSRILERLEAQGIVSRVPDGYAVAEQAKGQASFGSPFSGRSRISLLHTLLPYDVRPPAVVEALKGRWFDRLRWVGVAETEDGVTLKWVTDDGSVQLDARFAQGQLDIDARIGPGTDVSSAVRVAHQLMSRISHLYPGSRPRSRMMFEAVTDSRFRPAAM